MFLHELLLIGFRGNKRRAAACLHTAWKTDQVLYRDKRNNIYSNCKQIFSYAQDI